MPCTDWAADGSCPRGLQCAFYHGPEEQRLVTEARQKIAKEDPENKEILRQSKKEGRFLYLEVGIS